jgi:TldD protein
MIDPIAIARDSILAPAGLDESALDRLLGHLTSAAVDAADIYFQYSRLQSWVLEDGILKDGNFSIEQGAGLRAVSGEKTGFAYSDELQLPALIEAATAARAIARGGQDGRVRIGQSPIAQRLYEPLNPIDSLPMPTRSRCCNGSMPRPAAPIRACARSSPVWSRCRTRCWCWPTTAPWPPTCARWCG